MNTYQEDTEHGQKRWVAECTHRSCGVKKFSDSRSKAQGKLLSHARDAHGGRH